MKVLIAPMTMAGGNGPHVPILQQAGFELGYPGRPGQMTEEELLKALPGYGAVIAGSEPYTRKVMESSKGLRVIARAGVGYDAVDVAAATDHGVVVCIAPGTNQDAVAEHTFALILALAKRVVYQHRDLQKRGWPRQPTIPLRGRALGIAGLGRIGKAVALRGAAFGMRLLAYEPWPDNAFIARHNITLMPFDRLLAEADFLSLHVPLNPQSKFLINRQTLALMKPTAFLINTARGGLVCEADLLEALKNKQIAGAGLDVFEQEPPGENPLFHLDNVVATAHNAGVDLQSMDDMAVSCARSIVALGRGEWPGEAVVNPEVRAKFRW
jgi:D-3-phosphoglycerate dehydrogenase / 2-oxoglutarate reductase